MFTDAFQPAQTEPDVLANVHAPGIVTEMAHRPSVRHVEHGASFVQSPPKRLHFGCPLQDVVRGASPEPEQAASS